MPTTRPSPSCSSRSATPPASSARTTSATATSSCRPTTASTSSSATSTTSTPRRSPRTPTTRRTRLRSGRASIGPPTRRSDVTRTADRQAADRGHRPAHEEADGDDRRRGRPTAPSTSSVNATPSRQAVLRLVERHSDARLDARRSRGVGWRLSGQGDYHDGMVEHDGTSASCSTCSTNSASPTTPSSCTRPTTVRTTTTGPMAASPRSAARRTRTGKVPTACRASSAGPG